MASLPVTGEWCMQNNLFFLWKKGHKTWFVPYFVGFCFYLVSVLLIYFDSILKEKKSCTLKKVGAILHPYLPIMCTPL